MLCVGSSGQGAVFNPAFVFFFLAAKYATAQEWEGVDQEGRVVAHTCQSLFYKMQGKKEEWWYQRGRMRGGTGGRYRVIVETLQQFVWEEWLGGSRDASKRGRG